MKWANVTLFIKNIAKLHTYKHTYTLALAAADLKSAMENGSLCQVVLNKDFFQYGCNRVHLSSSLLIYSSTMYIVMVVCSGADCHSKKTRPGANIFFFSFSLLSLFVVQGISRYHTIWDLLFKATTMYSVPYIGLKNLPKSYSQLVNAISQQQWTVSTTRALCSMFAIGERGI